MAGRINILGHPVHPIVIVFPLGLLPIAVLFDVIFLVTHNGYWAGISFWLIAAGVIGGLLAAIFGLADWSNLPRSRATRIGAWHGMINVVALTLFAISWFIRRPAPETPSLIAIVVGFIGLGFLLFSGWLGGELVYRLSVGVDIDAHVNSPNSLSGRPAKEKAS
jgi:uncharacterized membrane protein